MTNWYSAETSDEQERLLAAWSDAPVENIEITGMLLEVARIQVMAFAPEEDSAIESDTPLRLIYAQLMQAQTLWKAGRANENGDIGTDGYSFQPRPMDKAIRSIIRPMSGVPDAI